MNKRILVLFLTFLMPNYNCASDIEQEIQDLEQKIKERKESSKSNENIAYLVLLRKEKAKFLAFRRKLEGFMRSPISTANLSYKPTIYSNIVIQVSQQEIEDALINGTIDDVFKKIDNGIKTIDETIITLDKAYTKLKRCILRKNNNSNCMNNFYSTTPSLSISFDETNREYDTQLRSYVEKTTKRDVLIFDGLNNDNLRQVALLRAKIALLRAKQAYLAKKSKTPN